MLDRLYSVLLSACALGVCTIASASLTLAAKRRRGGLLQSVRPHGKGRLRESIRIRGLPGIKEEWSR